MGILWFGNHLNWDCDDWSSQTNFYNIKHFLYGSSLKLQTCGSIRVGEHGCVRCAHVIAHFIQQSLFSRSLKWVLVSFSRVCGDEFELGFAFELGLGFSVSLSLFSSLSPSSYSTLYFPLFYLKTYFKLIVRLFSKHFAPVQFDTTSKRKCKHFL